MSKPPFKNIRFHMIATPSRAPESHVVESVRDMDWVDLPLDPALGQAQMLRLNLTLGMTLSTAKIRFTEAALGQMFPLLDVQIEFAESSFQVLVTRGIRSIFTEKMNGKSYFISDGLDLFRNAKSYHTNIAIDGSFNGHFYLISVSQTVLNSLIGAEMAQKLFQALSISALPTTRIISVPQFISNHLVGAFSSAIASDTRKLFAQAKSMEFLAALVEHFVSPDRTQVALDSKAAQRAKDVHAALLATEGKLPTLDELAERHGRSAKLLNDEFAHEYGESIYSFITHHRLRQAHDMLLSTNVSIKAMSDALGYSHVSNFTIAFKRKFGYTPGSLRRN